MPQQPQQQSGQDSGMGPIWLVALLFLVLFIIWKGAHQYIVSLVFHLNIWEAQFLNLFWREPELARDIYVMQTIDPATIGWDQLIELTRSVGNYLRYPIAGLLIFLAFFLYKSNITLKFRRTHTMKTLRSQEQQNWPAIMPIGKQDLINVDINKGPWAMALSPIEFARKHKLLKKDDALLDKPLPGQEMTAGIRRGDAKRVFTLQLGPYWQGFDKCPPHARALAAVFMARMNRDRASAKAILDTINQSYSAGKPDYKVANSTLRKYQNSIGVQEILARHAYFLTVMASLLRASRDDGVVPSADFLWLKPVDRRLWYMLNCVGRQTTFVEVAGPFAHWNAEMALGRRSLVPMIDEAIKALEVAVKEVRLSYQELRGLQP